MMESTTEFRKENADFLEKLKIADIVICMNRSKVKNYFIDNNICNYLQKCYSDDINTVVYKYNISAYLISYGFKSNIVDIYDSYYNSIYIFILLFRKLSFKSFMSFFIAPTHLCNISWIKSKIFSF